MIFLQKCDMTFSEDSTNQSRDVSVSSKPSRHDVSLPTADQLPFKQVDNCPQVTTRVNKTFGSGSIRLEKRSISASRLDHHATESFPPRGEIGGMTTLKKCGFFRYNQRQNHSSSSSSSSAPGTSMTRSDAAARARRLQARTPFQTA
jgi:hypothetical protein